MKIVITGGAGFIGAALASNLANNPKNEVIAIDNTSSGDWRRIKGNVKQINLDIALTDSEVIQEILKDAGIVFHLAATKLHNAQNSFNAILQNNIVASQKIFENSGIAGVKRVVFTSSLYVYGLPETMVINETLKPNPSTFYGASKAFGESILQVNSQKYGYSACTARLFFIYGPHQFAEGGYKSVIISNFEKIISGALPTVFGSGSQVLDYLYIDDCIEALELIGKSNILGEFNISSNFGISILNLTKLMIKIANGSTCTFDVADWTDGTVRVGANEKLRNSIGWSPKIDLIEGLTRTWRSIQI